MPQVRTASTDNAARARLALRCLRRAALFAGSAERRLRRAAVALGRRGRVAGRRDGAGARALVVDRAVVPAASDLAGVRRGLGVRGTDGGGVAAVRVAAAARRQS